MKKHHKVHWFTGLLLGILLAAVTSPAQQIRIKLGTIAPQGTSYDKTMRLMSSEWQKASGGKVKVTVFSGGALGGEDAMVQRLRINSLQAGLLTAVGLAKVVPEVEGLQSLPMMFRSLDEVEHVNREMRPQIEKQLAEKGLVVLFWTDAGWVRFFSSERAVTPEEMSRLKMFVWAGNVHSERIYRKAGFRPVPLETGEILTGLKTGLLEAVPMPPFAANASQVYREAPHMLDLNWAPLIGAFVVNKETWDKIPADLQKRFRNSASGAGKLIRAFGRREGEQAVESMKERWGLKVHPVTPEVAEQWREVSRSVYPEIRGTIVPDEMFDEVERILREYRAAGGP